ncbi:MAG TPA: hypothetical protein VFF06_33535 [Polyangia bacterium]|nr:hypothetical protein [Polyangia bacterium]
MVVTVLRIVSGSNGLGTNAAAPRLSASCSKLVKPEQTTIGEQLAHLVGVLDHQNARAEERHAPGEMLGFASPPSTTGS